MVILATCPQFNHSIIHLKTWCVQVSPLTCYSNTYMHFLKWIHHHIWCQWAPLLTQIWRSKLIWHLFFHDHVEKYCIIKCFCLASSVQDSKQTSLLNYLTDLLKLQSLIPINNQILLLYIHLWSQVIPHLVRITTRDSRKCLVSHYKSTVPTSSHEILCMLDMRKYYAWIKWQRCLMEGHITFLLQHGKQTIINK